MDRFVITKSVVLTPSTSVDASITLKPGDVPGVLLSPNLSIENHTKLQLQRWLACRCLKQGGTKSDLVQRVSNCIKAGTDNNIFLGIDGGKWYDAKRRLIPIASTSSAVIIEDFKSIKWIKFPAQPIPHYFNKGHIYNYIVGTHFETEDYEAGEITGVTKKPFRRRTQMSDGQRKLSGYQYKKRRLEKETENPISSPVIKEYTKLSENDDDKQIDEVSKSTQTDTLTLSSSDETIEKADTNVTPTANGL
ncbi:hypothetical protein RN001_005764 [Aquatica leii]|uniref:SAP domain-containing protein n=1 Tax=Aquatica leii TaxID=1421715 RepID=A0AAN7P702_9COLE|nr:hypothetical protein RN001_005764 [Aquatica leii]